MSCEPDGSALPRFSSAYSSRTSSAGSPLRQPAVPEPQRPTLRVPVAMPARSMKRNVGSKATTTIEPGGAGLSRETNGWSIQPPAKAMR